MGKKNRNQKNRWRKQQQQQQDSDPTKKLSIVLFDVTKDIEQRNEDIISSMDDDVLCHIISFLPFKSAVQTSLLSSRWKDLWKRNFPVRKTTMDDAFNGISRFLQDFSEKCSQQPISKWGFQFNLGKGNFVSVAGEPDKSLHLDFSNVKQEFQRQFDWLLEVNAPSYYDLANFWWLHTHQIHTHQPSQISYKIKKLHLVSVAYLSSGAISSIMYNSKFLESLAIEKCNDLRSLQVKAGHSKLKKLTVLDCQQLESLHLKGCNLQSLRYRGKLLSFECCGGAGLFWFWHWDSAFCLEDAMLDFRQGPAYTNISSCGFKPIFSSMRDVKSLTLCRWVFEALICPMLLLPLSWGFMFNQLTEFWWIDYSKERYNSNTLISFLKLCPRLKRLYITIDPKSYKRRNITKCSVEDRGLARLEDLKVVKLEGFPNEMEEIMLAKRLKQVFNVEPLIAAKSNYLNCMRLLVKEPDDNELLKEGKDSYKFIETRVEHLYDLCPKHVHMRF